MIYTLRSFPAILFSVAKYEKSNCLNALSDTLSTISEAHFISLVYIEFGIYRGHTYFILEI